MEYYRGNILNTIKRKKADWIGLILHRNCPLKHVIEGREDDEEDVPRYWMALKNRESTGQ